MNVEFHVPSVPVAQPRQRHRIMQSGGRTFAHNYTPAKSPVNVFKAAVQAASSEAMERNPPMIGPVLLDVKFWMPRPKRLLTKKWINVAAWHDSKPELDNLLKGLMDAMTGIVFVDDRQVAALKTTKSYTLDCSPGVDVVVRELE